MYERMDCHKKKRGIEHVFFFLLSCRYLNTKEKNIQKSKVRSIACTLTRKLLERTVSSGITFLVFHLEKDMSRASVN